MPTDSTQHLTVAELIRLLELLPATMPVWTEGCDCYGAAGGVRVAEGTHDEQYVLIERAEER